MRITITAIKTFLTPPTLLYFITPTSMKKCVFMFLQFHNSIHKDKGMANTININISQEQTTLTEIIIFYQKASIPNIYTFLNFLHAAWL